MVYFRSLDTFILLGFKMLKKLFKWVRKDKLKMVVVPRAKHGISRDDISSNALKVLYRLHRAGFSAYLVGGCIRDILLEQHPKDFDIATNASPEQIKDLFSNCRLIGRRFRLAHVHFGRDIIEVATFRSYHAASAVQNVHGMILQDNVYGTIEEDVLRRDFTVNALYYNIADFSVVDFVSGMQDLQNKELKLIGDPQIRYREDPVRMLRAIRFAAKLGFTIAPQSSKPIHTLGKLLANIPAARLFEEYSKLFLTGHALNTYKMLCEYGLFKQLFPSTDKFLSKSNLLIENALRNTDERVSAGKSVAPSFLLAVFSWHPLLEQVLSLEFNDAMDRVLSEQQRILAVPRRFLGMVRDVWELQYRLERRRSARHVEILYALSKFRAAYDFLLLRAESGEEQAIAAAKWWKTYVEADDVTKIKLAASIKPSKGKRKKSIPT
jgi:poly(A) polymerase